MAKDQLKYQEPATGVGVATFSFTEGGVERHIQRFQNGYQPFDVSEAQFLLNHGASGQDLYPCHMINYSGANWWTASGSGTNEYCYNQAIPANYLNTIQIVQVLENNSDMTQGDVGSLAAGEWGVGDNDTLGSDTIYVRLSDGTDPDTKATAYLTAVFAYPCAGASHVLCLPVFSATGQTAKVRPVLYAADLKREDGDTTYYNAPIILDEIDLASVDIELGDSAYKQFGSAFKFETLGAEHYTLALTTKPASGTIEFYSGVI